MSCGGYKSGITNIYAQNLINIEVNNNSDSIVIASNKAHLAMFTEELSCDSDLTDEVSGGAYESPLISGHMYAAAGPFTTNQDVITFPAPTADWGVIKAFGIVVRDSTTSGTGVLHFFMNVCPFVILDGSKPFSVSKEALRVGMGCGCC